MACAEAKNASHLPSPAATQTVADTIAGDSVARTSEVAQGSEGAVSYEINLTDTADWGNPVEDGQRALLRRGRAIIDTVDLDFGVSILGRDSMVFHTVRTDTAPMRIDSTTVVFTEYLGDYVFWTPAGRRELSHLLPLFHQYASSPAIAHESVIHYWGIAREDTTNRLYAMRYDFRTARLDSLFLNRRDQLATDYRYYLGTPRLRGSEVAFDRIVLDAATWRVIREDPPAN